MFFERFAFGLLSLFCAVLALGPYCGSVLAQSSTIVVEAERYEPPQTMTLDVGESLGAIYRDPGEFLATLPGVVVGRSGGLGVEPVIRGQQQNQLNIIEDGSFTFGACPNRMDPPTSSASLSTNDQITVERGYQTVTHGPGGPGGTVLISRGPPRFEPENTFRALARAGLDTNGSHYHAGSEGMAVGERSFANVSGFFSDSDNYEDGGGREVRSAFTSFGGGAIYGWRNKEEQSVDLSIDYGGHRDVLYEGLSMDSPYTDTFTYRLRSQSEVGGDVLRKLQFDLYSSIVDHEMDNFSLRDRSEGFARAVSDSDTFGGRWVSDLQVNNQTMQLGIDVQSNNRDAKRFANMMSSSNVNMVQSILWPDVSTTDVGAFLESELYLSERARIRVGARYDFVRATASRRSESVDISSGDLAPIRPEDLYAQYYGTNGASADENNVGGLLRTEYDLFDTLTLFSGVSRVVRTADATERFFASSAGGDSWIGNPEIRPEKHHQVDLGGLIADERWDLEVAGYLNWVEDYIFRDRARGQHGVLSSNGATIYRNIDAFLSGVETSGHFLLMDSVHLYADLTYTYGENRELDIPLPQIPPLTGDVSIVYEPERWSFGVQARFAGRQPRVDTDPLLGSGRDVRETPGWVAWDILGKLELRENWFLRSGLKNVFNKQYAYHLNRSAPFDPEEVQVNEPGRSFILEIQGSF